jgi:hypothetical protein
MANFKHYGKSTFTHLALVVLDLVPVTSRITQNNQTVDVVLNSYRPYWMRSSFRPLRTPERILNLRLPERFDLEVHKKYNAADFYGGLKILKGVDAPPTV